MASQKKQDLTENKKAGAKMEDIKSIFSGNLKRLMDENLKSRRDLSDALGISYYTITDWVNGKKYPRMDKVEKLADYFGVQKSDLIEDNDAETEKPVMDDGLNEAQISLINFARSLSEDQAALALRVLKSIVEDDQ